MLFLLTVLTLTRVQSASIGTIGQARILTSAPATWLYNQSSSSQCVCYSLGHPFVVAFNSYPLNGTCQLFSNVSAFPFQIISDANVSVYLLQPLQRYTPCCSNLTWLLTQMKSQTVSRNITMVQGLALDTDRNRLGVISSTALQLLPADLVTPTYVNTTPPYHARPISYHQGFFYVGIFPVVIPAAFHIYAASNLTEVGTINFIQGSPQRIVWLFNDTLVCVLIQNGSSTSLANFYNWPSNTLSQSVPMNISNAFGLAKAPNDDTFVYMTDGGYGKSIWRLGTTSPYNFSHFASSMSNTEAPANLAIDSCNRVWVIFLGFGLRIYDLSSGGMLGTWNMSSAPYNPGLLDLILTSQYQLYLADNSAGTLTCYGSALQCTN